MGESTFLIKGKNRLWNTSKLERVVCDYLLLEMEDKESKICDGNISSTTTNDPYSMIHMKQH